ncbi:unnamed protein product, partial [uncultured virus]
VLGADNTVNGDYPFLTLLASKGAGLIYVLGPAHSSKEE